MRLLSRDFITNPDRIRILVKLILFCWFFLLVISSQNICVCFYVMISSERVDMSEARGTYSACSIELPVDSLKERGESDIFLFLIKIFDRHVK